MTLTQLKLTQFTVFEDAQFELCPGVNVLIGKNSTGKSHALKAGYALLRGLRRAVDEKASASERDVLVAERFNRIFLPERLDRLIRRPALEARRGAEVQLTLEGQPEVVFTIRSDIAALSPTPVEPPSSLFIPSRDVLAFSEGFVRLYEKREISFDETYADLCRALEENPLREPPGLMGQIESTLGGKVRKTGDRFYVTLGSEEFEAHLVGEGLRKIATVVRLLANGSLAKGSVLFWDEPEAGLNPKMIADIAGFIRALASWGVQVLVATHDYLLTSRLSVMAATRAEPTVPTRFFLLHRESLNDPVALEQTDTLEEVEDNPILQAHAELYDYKHDLFARLDE